MSAGICMCTHIHTLTDTNVGVVWTAAESFESQLFNYCPRLLRLLRISFALIPLITVTYNTAQHSPYVCGANSASVVMTAKLAFAYILKLSNQKQFGMFEHMLHVCVFICREHRLGHCCNFKRTHRH